MKKLILILALILIVSMSFSQEFILQATGDYFGQNPPQDSAIIFAPGIISVANRYEYALAISPNHDEVFFTAEDSEDSSQLIGLIRIKRSGNNWIEPQRANLNQQEFWEQEAFFSPDGNMVYYAVSDSATTKIWYSIKEGDDWSKGQYLNSPINKASKRLFYATLSKNSNLYFTNVDEFKIYKAEYNKGDYVKFEEVGLPRSGHAFIAPDESFMLIDSRGQENYGKLDIYLTYKQEDGSWSAPINLGPAVNTEYSETCPSMSPDGKYIFFGRYNDLNDKSDIYWISSDIIKKLKP